MVRLGFLINEYTSSKKLKFSEHTLVSYELTFRRAVVFFGEDKNILTIKPEDISDFLCSIPGHKKTMLNAHIALSSLFTYAVKRNYIATNTVHLVDAPDPEERIIIPFTEYEIRELLTIAQTRRNWLRDRAIIFFLLDTGVVLGKGGKERTIPVSADTWRVVDDYVRTRPVRPPFLFLSELKQHYKPHGLFLHLVRLGNAAQISRCYPHRFRHTFAVNYLLNGGDALSLQKILGHTTLDMVKKYVEMTKEDIFLVHKRASPVKNWELCKKISEFCLS